MYEHVIEQDTLETPDGKEIYLLNPYMDCLTDNLVYGTARNRCSEIVYVGETGTALYSRVMNHLSTTIWKYRRETLIVEHFTRK